MEIPSHPHRNTARLAALLFFLVCIPLYFWEQTYVRSRVFIAQDPVATANNLLSHELVFRFATVTNLAGTVIFALLLLTFAHIFRPVNKYLSRLMVAAIILQIPVTLVLELFNIAALATLKSEARPTFTAAQQQETAYFLLRMWRVGVGTGKLFSGFCLIPFGMLVFKSGLAPKIIAILIIISGIGYLGDFSIYVLLERPDYVIVRSILQYSYMGYMLALLWFVIMGLRNPQAVSNH
jgi:hypothetical protein